jgi:hypothetical protein
MRVLVTGCGRSGTHYIAAVLRILGLDVGHEVVRKDGMVNWETAAVARTELRRQYDIILHQVRHPHPVIEASKGVNDHSRDLIRDKIPSIHTDDPPILFGMKYWYYWNEMAKSKAHYSYRVETLPEKMRELMAIMGMPGPFEDKWDDLLQLIWTIPKTVNSYRDQPDDYLGKVTYSAMRQEAPKLVKKITAAAKGYGYSVEDLYRNNNQ